MQKYVGYDACQCLRVAANGYWVNLNAMERISSNLAFIIRQKVGYVVIDRRRNILDIFPINEQTPRVDAAGLKNPVLHGMGVRWNRQTVAMPRDIYGMAMAGYHDSMRMAGDGHRMRMAGYGDSM